MAQYLDYNGIKEFHQKIVGAPTIDESEYIFGVKDNKLVRVSSDVLDSGMYTFDMSLITSSNANVGVDIGIMDINNHFVNITWNAQGKKEYTSSRSHYYYTDNTTEHNYNVTVNREEFGNNILYINIMNNYTELINGYTNLITANIISNMPFVYMQNCFHSCTNLTSIEGKGVRPTYMWGTFINCRNLTSLDGLANWDTGNLTDMSATFQSCRNLTSLDSLANWDTGNVTNMYSTFQSCYNLTSLDGLANWDTGKVTNMAYTFQNCQNLTSLDGLANWNVAKVTNIFYAFNGCQNLTSLDGLANWNVAKVTNMSNAFQSCSNAKTHGFNNWSGANANCASMFQGCNSLDDIQIHWNVTCAANMFASRNTPLNVYASSYSPNAWGAIYKAMGNSTTNSNWNVTLHQL